MIKALIEKQKRTLVDNMMTSILSQLSFESKVVKYLTQTTSGRLKSMLFDLNSVEEIEALIRTLHRDILNRNVLNIHIVSGTIFNIVSFEELENFRMELDYVEDNVHSVLLSLACQGLLAEF